MKTLFSERFINGERKPVYEIYFGSDELEIIVEGYQFESDMFAEEPEGDYDYYKYKGSDIVEALKNFIELIEEGFEEVNLTIQVKRELLDRTHGFISISKNGVRQSLVIFPHEFCNTIADKLKKIVEILTK